MERALALAIFKILVLPLVAGLLGAAPAPMGGAGAERGGAPPGMGTAPPGMGTGLPGMAPMPGGGFFPQPSAAAALQVPLGATKEEWKVLGPKVQRVIAAGDLVELAGNAGNVPNGGFAGMGLALTAFANDPFNGPSENASGFGPGGPGGRGGPGGFGGPPNGAAATAPAAATVPAENQSPQVVTITQALADLRSAAGDAGASPEKLRQQLDIYRVARERARRELEEARRDLRGLLTPDQEAILVVLGYLE